MRKRILPFIMIMLMIFTALPISASASTLYYGKTINSGETYTDTSFEMWCWYGNETFTNNGTVNISNGFTLGYLASFVNNSEFTFTGSNSTFGVSSGCSFQNNGTARISGCYNLGLEDSFVNTGTLYLSDISNFNVSGIVNTGKIVCGNGVPDRLIDALKEKSSGDGTVVKEGESTLSTSTRYTITYDGNPPARKGGARLMPAWVQFRSKLRMATISFVSIRRRISSSTARQGLPFWSYPLRRDTKRSC